MANRFSTNLRPAPAFVHAPFAEADPSAKMNGVGGLPRYVQVYQPELYPIPDAQEFNPSGTAATSAVGTGTITLSPSVNSKTGIQLPSGNIGILRNFAISITNMQTTTNVTFSLLMNNAPVGGYGGISIIPRSAPFVIDSFDCFIRIPDGALLTVQFSNIDGGPYTVGASLGGWYWPTSSGVRWLAGGV